MGGFVEIMKRIAMGVGVPEENIFQRGNDLPGYFRPTKDWDLLIISSGKAPDRVA